MIQQKTSPGAKKKLFRDNLRIDPRQSAYGDAHIPIFQDAMVVDELHPGIDVARRVKRFLTIRSIRSRRRTVIINNADMLTIHAQHAMLQVSEDAPRNSFIILVGARPELLLSTLLSRLLKVYFKRPPSEEVVCWLQKEYGLTRHRAQEIHQYARGLPGRAVMLMENPERTQELKNFITRVRHASLYEAYRIIQSLESEDEIDTFFDALLAEADYKHRKETIPLAKELLKRQTIIKSTNANKRLQLEAAVNKLI